MHVYGIQIAKYKLRQHQWTFAKRRSHLEARGSPVSQKQNKTKQNKQTESQIEAGCLQGGMAPIALGISWGYGLSSRTRDHEWRPSVAASVSLSTQWPINERHSCKVKVIEEAAVLPILYVLCGTACTIRPGVSMELHK